MFTLRSSWTSGAILRNREGLFVATFFSRIVILSRAATSQSKQQESFHRRDAEYAVFGIFLVQELFYSASAAPRRCCFMPHNLGYVTIKAGRVISPQRRRVRSVRNISCARTLYSASSAPRRCCFMPHNLGYVTIKAAESFHHRDAEYAVFGIFLVQELFTPRPPRLGGECPSCFSPRRRRGSQRDLLLQRRNSTISIQHLKRSTSASMTRENFAPVALPDVREKWSTSTDATR